MNLFVRGLLASGLLLAGLIFAGCDSFSGDSPPPAGSDSTTNDVPVVARFHIGDTVSVVFSGIPDPSDLPPHEETIKEDGNITLPLIGAVHAEDKTAGELQNDIHDRYVPNYYVRLTVTVKAGDLIYYVSGEVNSHGSREIYVTKTTVTQAITSAGGLTDFASHKVWLIRADGQRIKVDYDDALQDQTKDPEIYPGDQVNVPRKIF
jgi:polysaccharide export outer membrane protein